MPDSMLRTARIQQERLEKKLRIFFGLDDDSFSNVCFADGYFFQSIVREFGRERVRRAYKQMRLDHPVLQNRFIAEPTV